MDVTLDFIFRCDSGVKLHQCVENYTADLQGLRFLEIGIFEQEVGIDWIIHLDTDELMHPAGAPEYSLQRLLNNVAPDVDMVVFPNYVSFLPTPQL
jgi:hypothetical protein